MPEYILYKFNVICTARYLKKEKDRGARVDDECLEWSMVYTGLVDSTMINCTCQTRKRTNDEVVASSTEYG